MPSSSAVQPPPSYPCSLSQVLFPFFFFSFFPFHPNLSAATSPSPPPHLALTQAISRRRCHQPHRPPLDTGLLHPPVACKHPPHLPSRACMPPIRPPHNHHHLNASTTGVTRLCHTDRGCKRCAGPHHFRDTPIYSPSPFV